MIKMQNAIFVIALSMTISITVSAQISKGSVRVNLDTNIVNFNLGSWNPAGPEDWRQQKLEAGIGNPNVMLGIGVTPADALAIGIKFLIGYDKGSVVFDEEDSSIEEEDVTTDFDSMKYSHLRWGIAPYLEYAFGAKVIRPFLMLLLGFEGQTDNVTYVTSKYWDFVLGMGGGIHLFGGPNVSIDITLLLGFSAGGGSIAPEIEDAEVMTFTRVLFRLSGGLGISGWF